MNTIYDFPAYKQAFDTANQLQAKLDELILLKEKQRAELAAWQPAKPSGVNALDRALHALSGTSPKQAIDNGLHDLQEAYSNTVKTMDALTRGIPEAGFQLSRLRLKFTAERLKQKDMQKAIARQVSAARDLVEANRAMNKLCDDLAHAGFATQQTERDGLTLDESHAIPLEYFAERVNEFALS